MNRMPPHLEQTIRKNPNAVLTERGIVLKRTDRIDELLVGIPNADKLYGEHFDVIKAERGENLASIQPKATATPEEKSESTPEDAFEKALTEAKANPKYAELSEDELKKRVQMSLAAKERMAKKKVDEEAKKAEQ